MFPATRYLEVWILRNNKSLWYNSKQKDQLEKAHWSDYGMDVRERTVEGVVH